MFCFTNACSFDEEFEPKAFRSSNVFCKVVVANQGRNLCFGNKVPIYFEIKLNNVEIQSILCLALICIISKRVHG